MKMRLEPSNLDDGLSKILIRLARSARQDLEEFESDPSSKVHDLRTATKKIRSILRLLRRKFPKETRAGILDGMRRLKDHFAASRDQAVVEKTAALIFGADAPARYGLKQPRLEAIKPQKLIQIAEDLAETLEEAPIKELEKRDLRKAFRRACRRAAAEMGQAQETPACSVAFHEWRKRTKDVWYQASVLRDLSRKARKVRKPARKLSELLGIEHDLSVMEAAVELERPDRIVFDSNRDAIRNEVFQLGTRLFVEKLALDPAAEHRKRQGKRKHSKLARQTQ